MSATTPRRFIVIPPDGRRCDGFDSRDGAEAAAKAWGDGAHIVDTIAQVYHPIAQRIEDGEPLYLEYGAWNTSVSADQNVIEAIKKGYAPIVQAYLAKDGSPNALDAKGGTALHWAAARGDTATVVVLLEAGANATTPDAKGVTPLDVATKKGNDEIAALLRKPQ